MRYTHANHEKVNEFIQENIQDKSNLRSICGDIFHWFDKNIKYSRLNAPFFPLQRCDLDVLSMQSGTCGDYSNFLVSVLQTLGYEVRYAYVHRDCFGDAQDHICVAVQDAGQWILIDATLPYRKWYGYDCPHKEYELLEPDEFENKMKKEEDYWQNVAKQYGNELFAGLLYAPWINDEIIRQTENTLDSVFFLLLLDEQKEMKLYAYYMKYTKVCGYIPVMCIVTKEAQKYCFSCEKPDSIWDNEQWSEMYSESEIPESFNSQELSELKRYVADIMPDVMKVLSDLTQ